LTLHQMEQRVNSLKYVREDLGHKYEAQLDKAIQEMQEFYEKIENQLSQNGRIDDSLLETRSIEDLFLIKPSEGLVYPYCNDIKIENQAVSEI
jgi:hypothetical protein